MSATAPAAPARLPVRTKIAFGIGGMAETIALFSLSSWVLLYYNQVLGLPAALAGLAMMISLLIDGFVDPIVGSLSDRTRSKLGRRHPYMFAAPVVIALSYFAIFNPPAGLDHNALFLWFTVSVSALRIAMAFFHTPHLALGGELTTNYVERSQVMAYNTFFTWVGGAMIFVVGLRVFFHATPEYERGLLNPAAYGPFSLFAALSALTILLASAWFTRDQIPRLPKPPENLPKFSPFEFLKDVGKVLRNMNYVWLLAAYFALSLTTGVRSVLNTYVATYFFELTSEQLSYYVIGSFAGFLFAFVASARLHGKYDKKAVMIWTGLLMAIIPAVPVVLRFAGLLFENGHPLLVPTLILFSGLSFCVSAVLSITVMSALADIADENELKFGLRQEGVLYATRALFAKIDTAIGTGVAGLVLALIAFPERAHVGGVSQDTLNMLAFVESPLCAIPALIAVFFYGKYKINLASYTATRAKLDERKPLVVADEIGGMDGLANEGGKALKP